MAKAKKKRPAARKRAVAKRPAKARGASGSERPKDDAWLKLVERAVLNSGSEPEKPQRRGKSKQRFPR